MFIKALFGVSIKFSLFPLPLHLTHLFYWYYLIHHHLCYLEMYKLFTSYRANIWSPSVPSCRHYNSALCTLNLWMLRVLLLLFALKSYAAFVSSLLFSCFLVFSLWSLLVSYFIVFLTILFVITGFWSVKLNFIDSFLQTSLKLVSPLSKTWEHFISHRHVVVDFPNKEQRSLHFFNLSLKKMLTSLQPFTL